MNKQKILKGITTACGLLLVLGLALLLIYSSRRLAFTGTVESVEDGAFCVVLQPEQALCEQYDRLYVPMGRYTEEDFAAGDRIRVVYSGKITEKDGKNRLHAVHDIEKTE